MSTAVARGFLARLLFGAAEVSVTPDAVVIGGPDESRVLLARMTAPARVRPGPMWSTIVLGLPTGDVNLKGLPRGGASKLTETVNLALRRHGQGQLCEAIRPLIDADAEIAGLQSATTYIRGSDRRGLVERASAALAVQQNPFWPAFASPPQRGMADRVSRFVSESATVVAPLNERIVASQMEAHADLFDSVESKPLTPAQRRACVVCDDHNLVLAGAGTGKTSTMVGRAAYLLASGATSPDRILMLAFAKKAADELQERIASRLGTSETQEGATVQTFHSLGLRIIGETEGKRPDVSPLAEDTVRLNAFIDNMIDRLCEDDLYLEKVIRYCATERYPYRNPFDFSTMVEYEEYLRTTELRTLQGELVKSFEEVAVANFLNSNGVAYEYERVYPIDLASERRRQYRPDFYLPQYDIYIEHFALDKAGNAPGHFAPDYVQGVEWKRAVHGLYGTTLIETHSWMKRAGVLETTLRDRLAQAGVRFSPREPRELLDELREAAEVRQVAETLGALLGIFKQSDVELDALRLRASPHVDSQRLLLQLDLFSPVLDAYERELADRGHIDFSDMIKRATSHVDSGRYESPFTHVLVDEFQDISRVRAELLRALLRQPERAMLFAVGDDWQSIYRFTGSDIGYTREFGRRFGDAATTSLDTTFRFNSGIGDVASRFVLRNPQQVRKEIRSLIPSTEPTVSLVPTPDRRAGLMLVLDAIERRASYGSARRASVLVLARYNYVLDEWTRSDRRRLSEANGSLDIEYATAHAAKGREADYVVVVGLERGRNGFPAEKYAEPLHEMLLPAAEDFPHAEERRLFYVALTRARRRVYLVYDPMQASTFVNELREAGSEYAVCTDEFRDSGVCKEFAHVSCPACGVGVLVPRADKRDSRFAGCSRFPYCTHTERLCEACGSPMRSAPGRRVCPECGVAVRTCPECGGDLVHRSGKYGPFIGCSNYGRTRCSYKERLS